MNDLPSCPGPDCKACNGEACDLCGAGCGNTDPNRPVCEHDVIERHTRPPARTFQWRVKPWLLKCFGSAIANDRVERNHRFLEEALELVQALGCERHDAHALVDYVFDRATGEPRQEIGGVMVTLAALCLANGLDMHEAGEAELARIWTKIEQIRSKQAGKPRNFPLPGSVRS